jgi:hypothetical protein
MVGGGLELVDLRAKVEAPPASPLAVGVAGEVEVVGEKALTGCKPGSQDCGRFFIYCRQNGIWPNQVTGFDPSRERDEFTPYCPIRNLSANYPVILMIYRTADTDVPLEKSVEMTCALGERNLLHELILISNVGYEWGGGDPKIDEAYARVFEFIKRI